jgi:hypothetical protein
MRLKEMHGCHLRGLQGLLRKSQSGELSACCAGPVKSVQSYGMQYESENPLSGVAVLLFPRNNVDKFGRGHR